MQVSEQVGATFLLQETKPVALHGALTIVTSGADTGWISASLCPFGSELSCDTEPAGSSLKMSVDVAIRFASTLLILATQYTSELREDRAMNVGDLEVSGSSGQKVIRWISAKSSPNVKITHTEDDTEIRLHCTFAVALAFRILRKIGEISAQPASGT